MDNTLPKFIVVKWAVNVRNYSIAIGVVCALLTYLAFNGGDVGYGMLFGLAAAGFFTLAAKIKTKKWLRGKSGVYG